ncbi:HRAS-like suppressor 3 [Labeo rohita]|uniref:HRAS-like suppressor 3 n=1 Tax=Labeo rohita TaxID=84645 RepID=A0A498N8D8_LABRO|nr:HRAS-like suppressor 3 [Labeo rohita]
MRMKKKYKDEPYPGCNRLEKQPKKDREPELGDLIEISRDGYQHWAIYVGDGYVIHVVSDSEHADTGASKKSKKDGNVTVKKEKLQDVVGNDKYRINNHLDEKYNPRPIKDILQQAESFVGREFPYDLLLRNFSVLLCFPVLMLNLKTDADFI